MKHLLLFCISLLVSVMDITAQEKRTCSEYDFSPHAFSMITNQNVQPDLNSGTLNLSIPVYDWKDEDFSIPVKMLYSTNGFKPSRPTGIVGLDWSLQIGGVITRQIEGIDDLTVGGYYYKPKNTFTSEQLYQLQPSFYYNDTYGTTIIGQHEITPDVFHFSFLDHSGSFVLDPKGNFVVFDSNGERGCYEISFLNSLSGSGFKIETDDGYQYYFGTDEKSRERLYTVNSVRFTSGVESSRPLNLYEELPIITWHLSKIVAPNGHELFFNYSSQSSYQGVPLSNDDVSTTFGQGLVEFDRQNLPAITTYKHPSITTVSYLDNITLDTPALIAPVQIYSFEYSYKDFIEKDNNDNYIYYGLMTRQKKLDKVRFYNHSGNQVGELQLTYLYRNTRMLLSQLWISNVGNYEFSYNLDKTMPGILTNAIDFWGFYNGRTDNSDADFTPTEIDLLFDEHLVDDYKNPNSQFSIAGTLKSITYPTGGRTEFDYEPNTASYILRRTYLSSSTMPFALPPTEIDTTSHLDKELFASSFLPSLKDFNYNLGLQECGGVRIKSISDYDDTTCLYTRTYSYNIPGTSASSGVVLKFNRYFSKKVGNMNEYDPYLKFPDGSLDKQHVAYSYVTEHLPDGSYNIYRYTDYHSYPDSFSQYKIEDANPLGYSGTEAKYMNNILREPNSRHYRRGLLKTIESYNNDNEITLLREYNYEDSDSSYVAYIVGSGDYWWSARRFTCDFLLKRIDETRYQDGIISSRQLFEYNDLGQISYEALMDNESQNGYAKYYRYCYEDTDQSSLNRDKKAPCDIIQTRIRFGTEYVIGNTELKYDPENVTLNPIEIKEYFIRKPISIRNLNHNINSIAEVGRDGFSISTTYDYDSRDRLERISKSDGSYVKFTWDDYGNYIIRKEENDLTNSITYQWKDMVGVSHLNPPAGQSTSYEYDSKNRLKSLKEEGGSMIQEYMYYLIND